MNQHAHPWWIPAGAFLAAGLVRVLAATWRVDRRYLTEWDGEMARGAGCIFAVWHGQLFPLVHTHRHRGIVVLVSRHRDGEWIARLIEHFGFGAARGSSTRGGEAGIRELMAALGQRRLIGVTPDGPRGPAEQVKPGVIWLASRSGLPVVPIATAADRTHVFGSWDRFRVPLPFARVVAAYGSPIRVPGVLNEEEFETWRLVVQDALHALTRRVEAEVAGWHP